MDALCGFTFIAGFFACIIAYIVYIITSNTGNIKVWEKFAAENSLNITPGFLFSFPKITGKYKGFDYVLETISEGDGESSNTYTVITIKLPKSLDYDLYIYQEGFLSKIGKMFGGQDIQIGNREFDDTFMIKSQTPYIATGLITDGLQRKMLHGHYLINISLSGNKMVNKAGGIIKEEQDLLYLSEIMWELAMNTCGEKISNISNNILQKPSQIAILHEKIWKRNEPESDFTVDIPDSPSFLKKDKICPYCNSPSPGENKYCIDCGREI